MPHEKKKLFTWDENVPNKKYVSWGLAHSLFLNFFVKCQENNLHRKYTFFGVPAENVSSTISQMEQNL